MPGSPGLVFTVSAAAASQNRFSSAEPPDDGTITHMYTVSETRWYQFCDGSSDKFWAVARDSDGQIIVVYGPTGRHGQSKARPTTETCAADELDKLVVSKLAKGYCLLEWAGPVTLTDDQRNQRDSTPHGYYNSIVETLRNSVAETFTLNPQADSADPAAEPGAATGTFVWASPGGSRRLLERPWERQLAAADFHAVSENVVLHAHVLADKPRVVTNIQDLEGVWTSVSESDNLQEIMSIAASLMSDSKDTMMSVSDAVLTAEAIC